MSAYPVGHLNWLKSSYCKDSGCIVVAALPDGNIAVMDTKDTERSITVAPEDWDNFLAGAVAGEFNRENLPQRP